jgi:hypothetical protein
MPKKAPKQLAIANGNKISVNGLTGSIETNPNHNVVTWQGFKMKIIVRVKILKYTCRTRSVKHRIP